MHLKVYTAPQVSFSQTERGIGLGVAYNHIPNTTPSLALKIGFAVMEMQKRSKLNNQFDSDFPSILAEIRIQYRISNNLFLSSGISAGYGKTFYINQSNKTTKLASDIPYLLSFGVGYQINKNN